MLRLSRDQIDAPRAVTLARLWHRHAASERLTPQDAQTLEAPVVHWIMAHGIERPENVDFAMLATARSGGAFLDAEPIREAMRLSGGEYEITLSAIRRETLAIAAQEQP